MKKRYVLKNRRLKGSLHLQIRDTTDNRWLLAFGSVEDMNQTVSNMNAKELRKSFHCISCNDFALPSFTQAQLKVISAA